MVLKNGSLKKRQNTNFFRDDENVLKLLIMVTQFIII